MTDFQRLNTYINKFKGLEQQEVVKALGTVTDLSMEEKNIVYIILFPRPLLDRELPTRVMEYRRKKGNERGWMEPDAMEVGLLVEAYRTPQYGRFMRHLLHSFLDPEQIHPLTGTERTQCPLCGKTLYHYDYWKSYENQDKCREYLAFGSNESSMELCLDCIIQLQGLDEALKITDGPNYINSYVEKP